MAASSAADAAECAAPHLSPASGGPRRARLSVNHGSTDATGITSSHLATTSYVRGVAAWGLGRRSLRALPTPARAGRPMASPYAFLRQGEAGLTGLSGLPALGCALSARSAPGPLLFADSQRCDASLKLSCTAFERRAGTGQRELFFWRSRCRPTATLLSGVNAPSASVTKR